MSDTRPDDGGPAFPRTGHQSAAKCYDTTVQDGMTLWDWYAGEAIRGAVANQLTNARLAAKIAADMADAMLRERRERGIGSN